MVIVGGYNVYPREVEEVLFAHPDVVDAAVIGRPDAYRGEILVAYVVLRPGAVPDADRLLLAHCRERLAQIQIAGAVALRRRAAQDPGQQDRQDRISGDR